MRRLPVFETKYHFVMAVANGFEIFQIGPTAAERIARIGYKGHKGFLRAKLEIERREAAYPDKGSPKGSDAIESPKAKVDSSESGASPGTPRDWNRYTDADRLKAMLQWLAEKRNQEPFNADLISVLQAMVRHEMSKHGIPN